MGTVELERFALETLLGFGADYEVHAAKDRETGQQVVVRRPKPTDISRGWHHRVNALSERIIDMHNGVGESVGNIAHLIGYANLPQNDSYFGDSYVEEYLVLVEDRAVGIPLVADIRDKFLGAAIGLGQNLFALYTLVPHPKEGAYAVCNQLLKIGEKFHEAGYLLLDMRPQNVYFDPLNGQITVIDFSAILFEGEKGKKGEDRGINDFFLELLKFYVTPLDPPSSVADYQGVFGMRPAISLDEEVRSLKMAFSSVSNSDLREAGITMLDNIQSRRYDEFKMFDADFSRYLDILSEHRKTLPNLGSFTCTWETALELLSGDYWGKYIFDSTSDLSCYQRALRLKK